MKVIIDGHEVPFVNDVKIIHEDSLATLDGEEVEVETHLTVNSEGVIVDNIIPNEGFVVSTSWRTISDLVEECQ